MKDEITIEQAYETGRRNRNNEGHNVPSPETRERLSVLETNQTNFMEQNTKEHAEIKKLIGEIKVDLKEALEKKAGIWVEKVIIYTFLAIGGGIVAFLTWFFSTGTRHFQ